MKLYSYRLVRTGRRFRSGKWRHDGWDRKGVRPRDMRARINAREWGVRA